MFCYVRRIARSSIDPGSRLTKILHFSEKAGTARSRYQQKSNWIKCAKKMCQTTHALVLWAVVQMINVTFKSKSCLKSTIWPGKGGGGVMAVDCRRSIVHATWCPGWLLEGGGPLLYIFYEYFWNNEDMVYPAMYTMSKKEANEGLGWLVRVSQCDHIVQSALECPVD